MLILAPLGPGTILTLNPGTSGTVTGVSRTRQHSNWADKPHCGRTTLVDTGIIVGVDAVADVIAGPIDGQNAPDSGIILSLISQPLPSLNVSLLLLC